MLALSFDTRSYLP